ncbi:hypothetical protein BG011_003042, partial [Mortierella polycephala]
MHTTKGSNGIGLQTFNLYCTIDRPAPLDPPALETAIDEATETSVMDEVMEMSVMEKVTEMSYEKPKKGKKAQRDQDGDTPTKGPSDDTRSAPSPAVYYSLAVKQKAVYQPIFKYRHWLEEQKRQ